MQKRFQRYLAKHNCVEKCDCCGDHHILWEKSLCVDNEVALDLGCERCATGFLVFSGIATLAGEDHARCKNESWGGEEPFFGQKG